MLTAQDVSYDEARNLHTKWQKHQAFMAELAANKDWLDKVDKVSGVTAAARREPGRLRTGSWLQAVVLPGLEVMESLVPNLQDGNLWSGEQKSEVCETATPELWESTNS